MPAPTVTPDPDPVDRARGVDLGDVGLVGYCVAVTIAADGEERFALLKYNTGDGAVYWPADWNLLAPHEIPGLPIYLKD